MIDPPPSGSVIRFPFDFKDGNGYVSKLFVVVGHAKECAVVCKATSKLGRYGERRKRIRVSSSSLAELSLSRFPPSLTHPILSPSRTNILLEQMHGRVEIWLDPIVGLGGKLRTAIEQNAVLTKAMKAGLLGCLGSERR